MTNWKIDGSHSEVKFKVKHLVISTVTGQFKKFDAEMESDKDDFSDAKISFEADVNSIDTKDENRDGHLKSPDFFDAANHPKISFVSRSFVKKSNNDFELKGDFTMRGVTKEILLNVIYNGTVKALGGGDLAAFEIEGKIKRSDFGLTWNALTETGGIAVGDEVKLEIIAEMKKSMVSLETAA